MRTSLPELSPVVSLPVIEEARSIGPDERKDKVRLVQLLTPIQSEEDENLTFGESSGMLAGTIRHLRMQQRTLRRCDHKVGSFRSDLDVRNGRDRRDLLELLAEGVLQTKLFNQLTIESQVNLQDSNIAVK